MTTVRRVRGKGRAVHSAVFYWPGDIIEVCHVIIVGNDPDNPRALYNSWAYNWYGQCAIALGNGSLYSHSYTPNANWRCNRRARTITIFALKDIALGDEITLNYNGVGSMEPVGFKVRS